MSDSRRSFLKKGVSALAGISISPRSFFQENSQEDKKQRAANRAKNINRDHPLLWLSEDAVGKDIHAAFRGEFTLLSEEEIEIRLSGASWYVVWLDGEYFYEGPDRYPRDYPEYQSKTVTLPEGNHVLAIQVHNEGVETRILKAIKPFLHCKLVQQHKEIPLTWKCTPLNGYGSKVRRINAQLGWIEWHDKREVEYSSWKHPKFDDSNWQAPVQVRRNIGRFTPSQIENVKSVAIDPELINQGNVANVFGYARDDPSAGFFLRDLMCGDLPPQGVWKRYDLGRVRLCRPKFVLDVPEGAVVEFAYSEYLSRGRVAPWINLSASESCNMDHFVSGGGEQEFFPLHPKGARFVEIHVMAPSEDIKFLEESFLERSYYDVPTGDFQCDDKLLNEIWKTGIETYKACSEDALIDNPTRERGQWLGDVGIVGMQIGSCGFSDLSICRRGLVQSAQSARSDGMVAGLCPGGEAYLSSYAAQWVTACLNYWQLTGDKSLIEELFDAGERNISAFQRYVNEWGISSEAGWAFIDWGYIPNQEAGDMALNLHYFMALKGMAQWAGALGKQDKVRSYRRLSQDFARIILRWFKKYSKSGGFDWEKVGYHRAVLALKAGLIPHDKVRSTLEFVKRHILNCFPNNPKAPRLSSPAANNAQLITPYFAHYTFPLLIESGEIEFVLDQYRKCWGWALKKDRTTWLEVFDTRWSHCHQWSGCPTWQLTRYVLGLRPRFHQELNGFELKIYPGSLEYAEGKIPLSDNTFVHAKWRKKDDKIDYEIITPVPIFLEISSDTKSQENKKIRVEDDAKITIPF